LQLLAISVLHMSRHFILGTKLAQIDIRWERDNKPHETPPGPNIAAIPVPPLVPTVLHAADCGLFAIAFATALAYGEQPGHCLLDHNKMREHLLKPLQEGEMTPLPLKN